MLPLRFLAAAAQFGLLVLVIRQFELVSPNFGNLMVLALGGFVVHHSLPERFRLPWFVLLSLVGLKLVAGGTVGLWVTGCGLVLISICHLPIPFLGRIVLLLAAAAVVSLLRVGYVTAPVNVAAWIVLGSMFMFRTICYLYELRHQTAPFGPFRALAYFFMLPNVCFVLFPVVDYRTFCSSHFNDQPERIYATGLRWMLRGVVHLLLYRLVYQLMIISPLEATDLLSVVRFMLASYLLYLRVSGWFHLIVGLLHMYGFNLPETHHLYFLASSFTDFWRRINIYWKDFLLKVFFYPAYFRLKVLGPSLAMGLATLYAFFITWLLHSYQFFWIRGEWLLTWQDALFWGILALLVLANALWELRAGRRRSLGNPRQTWKSSLIVALQTIGTFVVICSLWTLWSCKSWEELAWLATASCNATPKQVAIVVLGLAAIGILGVWLGSSTAEGAAAATSSSDPSKAGLSFWRSASVVSVAGCSLIAVSLLPDSPLIRFPAARRVLFAVKYEALNQLDLAEKRRGYYEELDVARIEPDVHFLRTPKPDRWQTQLRTMKRKSEDFMLVELVPSTRIEYAGSSVTINRWGMRDREYTIAKPNGVYRIVLLGSSHEFGWGVSDNETFESVLEERLNSERPKTGNATRYEILNFAVYGHTILQQLRMLETRALRFEPDAVFFVVNSWDEKFNTSYLSEVLSTGQECPYPILENISAEAGAKPGMSRAMMDFRLKPVADRLLGWTLQEFVALCQAHNVRPYLVYRSRAGAVSGGELEEEALGAERYRQIAADLGISLLDLSEAYRGHHRRSLTNSQWDDHTNAVGHRLLADELYRQMMLPGNREAWLRATQEGLQTAGRGSSPGN